MRPVRHGEKLPIPERADIITLESENKHDDIICGVGHQHQQILSSDIT